MSTVLVTVITELAVSSLAVPRPSPVLIAPIHGGMARLNRPAMGGFGITANGHPSQH